MAGVPLVTLLGAELQAWQVVLTSLGGAGTFVAAWVGLLVWRTNREAIREARRLEREQGEEKARLDLVQFGQLSLKDALERSDKDKADLRRQILMMEERHENDRREWRSEMAVLTMRMERAETREAECRDQLISLTEEVRILKHEHE